jgi:hypothetical protein
MSLLNQVVTGKKMKPLALLVYADRGLGKTTFPMKAQKPIYITSEENDEYDIARLQPQTWDQLLGYMKAIRDDKHDYKTLVIDTLDTFEKIAQAVVLSGKNAGKTMVTAHGGYSKAYELQAKMFTDLLNDYIKPIRDKRKMNVVILAHAEKIKHEDPITSTSHDQYVVAIHKKHKPLYENWVSAILFLSYDLNRVIREDDSKIILDSLDGKRVIYTEERPAHAGKNRFELPYEIDFDKETAWDVVVGHIKDYFAKNKDADKKLEQAEKAAEEAEKKIVEEMKKDEPEAHENEPEAPTESPKEEEKNPALSPELAAVQKEIDDLWSRVPKELQGPIQTSIARGVAKQDVKELTRILNKIRTTINA